MGARLVSRSATTKRENKLQELLLTKRQALFTEIQKELSHYRVNPLHGVKEGGLPGVEGVVEAFEAEIEFAVIDQRAKGLRQVEFAVERLKAGSYGICEDCGAKISAARLKALPSASRCTQCQERWEATAPRMEEPGPILTADE